MYHNEFLKILLVQDISFTLFGFYVLMENEYIIFPSHTIPETQQNTAGMSGNMVICMLPEKSNAPGLSMIFCFSYIKDPLKQNKNAGLLVAD